MLFNVQEVYKIFLKSLEEIIQKSRQIFFIHTPTIFGGGGAFLFLSFYLCYFALLLFCQKYNKNGPRESGLIIFEGNWNQLIPTLKENFKITKGDLIASPPGNKQTWGQQ